MSNSSFVEYASQAIFVASSIITPPQIYASTKCSARELVNAGVTSTINFLPPISSTKQIDASFNAIQEVGIRSIQILELHPPFQAECWPREQKYPHEVFANLSKAANATTKQDVWSHVIQLYPDTIVSNSKSLIQVGFSLDAFGQEEEEETKKLPKLYPHLPRAIHAGTGLKPMKPLLDSDLLHEKTALIHGNALSSEEISILSNRSTIVVSTPEVESLVGLGSMIQIDWRSSKAPYKECVHALGSDNVGYCSSSPFTSMRIALSQARNMHSTAKGHTRGLRHPVEPRCEDVLTKAVFGASKMFQKEEFEPIYADLVVTSFEDKYNLAGCLNEKDAISAFVLQATIADVRDVLIGGEWRKHNGKLVDRIDEITQEVDTTQEISDFLQCRRDFFRELSLYHLDSVTNAFEPLFHPPKEAGE